LGIYDRFGSYTWPQSEGDIPETLFIHIVRDGRDIAHFPEETWKDSNRCREHRIIRDLSHRCVLEWMVRTGQTHGRKIPADYIEVRYEDLVLNRANARDAQPVPGSRVGLRPLQQAGLGRIGRRNPLS